MGSALQPAAGDALAEWAGRVRANREQAERVREAPEGRDFYAPVAAAFRADPRRTDEPALDTLRGLAQRNDTWLDIGAGGGRYALPLALVSREVVALDPSDGMLNILREGMAEHGITNISIMKGRWPERAPDVEADVCFIAHVGYDIEDIGPFLDAMERRARRLCVAMLLARSPASAAEPFWPLIHGEPRHRLPALPEFLALQLARGRLCEVHLSSRPAGTYATPEAAAPFLRQQLFIAEGGEKDQRLAQLLSAGGPGGGEALFSREPLPVGVVTWDPAVRI